MLSGAIGNGDPQKDFVSGIVVFVIPKGTQNLWIRMDDGDVNDDIQLFTTSGTHIAGTEIGNTSWGIYNHETHVDMTNVNSVVITPQKGFDNDASYDGSILNGTGVNIPFANYTPGGARNPLYYNGMTIGYSGDGNPVSSDNPNEYLTIDETTEDLILIINGSVGFGLQATWDYMPATAGGGGGGGGGGTVTVVDAISIQTQALAQRALGRIDDAIIAKDNIRAHLGATQNRLENTISSLQIQAENLQAAEARISDVDVALEMTEFIRRQILTQSATAMLAQANSLPNIIASLLE